MEVRGRIYSYIGNNIYSTFNIKKEVYVLDNIHKYSDTKKIIEALKMVNLNEDYLLKKSNDLSNTEYNKLRLVSDLVNNEKTIILDYFDKGLCYKEKEYFKRLFKKLSKNYGINFYIKTNDFAFCIDLVDEYLIFDNNKIVKNILKKDIYKEEIFNYYDKHTLCDFVIKSRKYNHLKDDYTDIKDVLKAVYRELK
jgi:ABC-type dipeptide/oligopeptide/nickel transport system ATPase subunit